MKQLSEKLTRYVIDTGAVSEESYAIYQYGFQMGLEMISCFATCFAIALYLHMIPEFLVSAGVFIILRTYAGGVHLNTFAACFLCSVVVQTLILIIHSRYKLSITVAWILVIVSAIMIAKSAPIDSINRELDSDEKKHCKKVTIKVESCIMIFAGICLLSGVDTFVSLIAITLLVVLCSQYIGAIKYKIIKSKVN